MLPGPQELLLDHPLESFSERLGSFIPFVASPVGCGVAVVVHVVPPV